jgi:hypothetical protein
MLPGMLPRLLGCFASLALAACGAASGPGDDDDDAVADATPGKDVSQPPAPRVEQLVRGDDKPRLVVEVDAVAGFEPRPAVETELGALLRQILDKPGGVQIVRDTAIASRGADHAWTDAELFALADQTFDLAVPSDTVKIHAMFLDGHSARDGGGSVILGLAWSNTHIAIFKGTIEDRCGSVIGLGPLLRERLCAGAERSIWTHEIGHVIGLVDAGLPLTSAHKDPEHGAHDVSDECVMYWAYEGERLVELLAGQLLAGGDATLPFDDACLADIAAVRDAP